MSLRYVSLVVVLTACVFLPASASAQVNDQIYGSGGTPTRGDISKSTPDYVEVAVGGSTRKIEVNKIRKINFGGEPNELRTARGHVAEGRYEDAIDTLSKLDKSTLTRAMILQDYYYLRAYAAARLALTGGGDKAAALAALKTFVSKQGGSKSHRAYECAEVLGDLAVSLQEYGEATTYYRVLERAPWKDYKMRSSVLQASALLRQEKYSEALEKYDEVVSSTLDDAGAQEQKRLATVGKATCLAEGGDADAGIKLIEKVINSNEAQQHPVLFGRAYNALGRCYVKAGKPKDALLAYLHVDVMFYAEPETHAEALYYLGQLWKQVKNSERAIQANSLLQSRYAGSPWSKKT